MHSKKILKIVFRPGVNEIHIAPKQNKSVSNKFTLAQNVLGSKWTVPMWGSRESGW